MDENHVQGNVWEKENYMKEILASTSPTAASVKSLWKELVKSGEISIGVPCAPYTVTHYSAQEDQLITKKIIVRGRKFRLKELRQKLLKRHEKYMQLNTDEEIETMSLEQLQSQVSSLSDCNTRVTKYTRYCGMTMLPFRVWERLCSQCMLFTTPVSFFTQSEWNSRRGEPIHLQATIECLLIHMIADGSSTVEDQASLLQDQVHCHLTLKETVTTSTRIEITDTLRLFVGNHKAHNLKGVLNRVGRANGDVVWKFQW